MHVIEGLNYSRTVIIRLGNLVSVPTLRAKSIFGCQPLSFRIIIGIPRGRVYLCSKASFIGKCPVLSVGSKKGGGIRAAMGSRRTPISVCDERFPSTSGALILTTKNCIVSTTHNAPHSPKFCLDQRSYGRLTVLAEPKAGIAVLEKGKRRP